MTHHTQLAPPELLSARAPRYTSYPTAPNFSDEVGPGQVKDWIGAIPAGAQVSLYVHVPFCRRLCWFCACRTQGTSTARPVEAYVLALKAELKTLAEALPPGVTLSRLHWGGGTPTILTPDLIHDLAGTIQSVLPLGHGAEFSVEVDPNEIDLSRVEALADAGMTRASVGVQDFDPLIQKAIGREQTFEVTRDAIRMLRATGIDSLNADILYGLPHQTSGRLKRSVEKLLSLEPDRVALYGYAHVPWMSARQQLIPTAALPGPSARLRLSHRAADLFVAAGYDAIGIDHFARPDDGLARAARAGVLRRNFQGYTDDQSEVLLGLGASSIARFPQGYAQNAPKTADYSAEVLAGHLPVRRGHAFAGEDLLRGWMIERLMCDFAVDAAHAPDPVRAAQLIQDAAERFTGMVELSGSQLRIGDEGRPFTRIIAQAFDGYVAAGHGHSIAV